MGWLDRLLGRSDRDRFADLVRRGLIAAGETRPMRYDKAVFALHLAADATAPETGSIFLGNVYADYARTPQDKQPLALKRIITSFTEGREPLPTSFAQAAEHLLPQVRPMTELGLMQLQRRLGGEPLPELPCRHLTPAVAAWLAYDRTESTMRVTSDHLAKWGGTFDEAFAAALVNLRGRSEKPFAALSPGLFCSDWADTYDTARLLLTDLVAALPVRGTPVAMVPNRNALLITGSDDPEGLRAMANAARRVLADPRSLGADALLLEAGSWRTFVPDPTRPGETELLELQEERASALYGQQKALLDAIHKKAGADIFVANHALMRERDTPRLVGSFATWTEGVDTLLPRAQTLVLVQIELCRMITVPWDAAAQIAGELLVPAGWWPERFRARHFPSAAQLERLQAAPGAEIRPISN